MPDPEPSRETEVVVGRADVLGGDSGASGDRPRAVGLVLLLACTLGGVWLGLGLLADDDAAPPTPHEVDDPPVDRAAVERARAGFAVDEGSRALLAAELFVAEPGRDTAAELLAAIGGAEALDVGVATGDFDLVTFDPADPSRLLASRRGSYGPAENQGVNEEWSVDAVGLSQSLFAPVLVHDVVHFTDDGAVAIWVNSGNTDGFASRDVIVGDERPHLFGPLYASRSVIVDDTLFALTGSSDYYAADRRFESLVADRAGSRTVLADGEPWAWIDSPASGLLVAYPIDGDIGTRVWDTATLSEQPDHPLAGQAFRRLDVSSDGRVAVAVTAEGELVRIDVVRRAIGPSFGAVDVTGIDTPVTVNEDGTTAITVGFDGSVRLWWVGDRRPLAEFGGTAGPARVVPEHRAPRAASAVEPMGRRVAVRRAATAETGPTTWQIFDTDVQAWIDRACTLARGPLTPLERLDLGLAPAPGACG